MNPLAEQLRAARLAAGLTQTAAARCCGTPLRTYHGWERGRGVRSGALRDALATLKQMAAKR